MRGKVSGLYLLLILQGCAHAKPTPAPVVEEPTGPKSYRLPSVFHDHDLLCVDVNMPGTCATVADVRQFLQSRKG